MKKYFILGAAVVVFGLLINYTLGGFASVEPKLVQIDNYTIYGKEFKGSYKSNELNDLVEKMRNLQHQLIGKVDVVIVNYFNEDKETVGYLENFVGIRTDEVLPDSITNKLEKRIIHADKALRAKIKIKPLVMPSPEKVKKVAFDEAELEGFKLMNLSVEQYLDSGVLLVEFPLVPKKKLSIQEKVAQAYGIDAFDRLKSLQYTFHVQRGDREVARNWYWEPKTGNVTLIEKGDTLRYNRNDITDSLKTTDAKFINDKYWLLFPFQLVWDTGYSSEKRDSVIAPISKEELTKFTIQYNNEDGYTPGDAYDFYIDKNDEIKEWSFRKGGQQEPSLTATWENYKIFNGIKIARDHYSGDKGFHLWFTGIEFK